MILTFHTATFRVGHVAPSTRPGDYTLFVSVGRRDGQPRIALPLPHEDGHRRYRLGHIRLLPEPSEE